MGVPAAMAHHPCPLGGPYTTGCSGAGTALAWESLVVVCSLGMVTDASALYVFYSMKQRDLEMRAKGSALSRKI